MSLSNLNLSKLFPLLLKNAAAPAPSNNPSFPYLGQRATPEDLESFPISMEDFFGGGGKIMFTDPAKPQTSAAPPPAMPAQLKKTIPAAPVQLKKLPAQPPRPAVAQRKIAEVVDSLLKKAVRTQAVAPDADMRFDESQYGKLSPRDQFIQKNIGQSNWEARNSAGVPGLTQEEEQRFRDQRYPDEKRERERWEAQQAQRRAAQDEAYRRSPEGRVHTMARNREVDTIAAQARQMTEANNAAKAQGKPLPYDGQQYAPTYAGGQLPATARPSAPPAPQASAKPLQGPPANPTETDRLLEADMQNPFMGKSTGLLQPGAPTQEAYHPSQGSSAFNPRSFNLAPQQLPAQKKWEPSQGSSTFNPSSFNLPAAPLTEPSSPVQITPPSVDNAPKTPGLQVKAVQPYRPGRVPPSTSVKPLQPRKITHNSQKTAEVETAWKGFVSELRKQGANDDFIEGILKEASEKAAFDGVSTWSKIKDVLKGSQAPDSTGAPANRHPIVPGLANKWLGGLLGMGLGHMVNNEIGPDGPLGLALPILGAYAGHKYLPHVMNRWKDAYGSGVNQVHPGVASMNRQNPISIPATK